MKKIMHLVLIGVVLLFVSGCVNLAPEYKKLEPKKLPSSWDKNSSKSIVQWWRVFEDDTLNELVKKVYEQNLDLRGAGLRILQARAALGISQGMHYPQVQSLSGSIAGVRKNSNNFANVGVNFDMSWEMDIWGRYLNDTKSAEATLYASVASYDEILVAIISEVVRNYINYRTAQERILFAKRNIAIQQRVEKMTQVQFNAGNVSELDMQQARTQLYTTQAVLPSLKLSIKKSKNAIAILLGMIPEEIDLILKDGALEELKVDLDNGLRSENKKSLIPTTNVENIKIDANLIERRPDIRVAEFQALSSNAKIGSIKSELYPHFSLFGSIGVNSNNVSNDWVSLSDSFGVSIGPAFKWNIFQYDRIKNQIRLQDAIFQEKLNNYNQKVLLAIREVSDALNGYMYKKEQLILQKKVIKANIRAFNLSMTQYNNGFVSYQRLLTTVEKLTKNEDAYAVIRGDISVYVVSLYKALGGGWQTGRERSYLHVDDVKKMKNRTDWGKYLDDTNLPKAKL